MKLRYSPTSPYVRKVLVVIAERGLGSRVEHVTTNPHDPASDLTTVNPLSKVPALVTDDGMVLYDSPVICAYLDSLHDGEPLIPSAGAERWDTMRLEALGDGVLDAALLCMMESRRVAEERSPGFVAKQKTKIASALDALDAEVTGFGDAPTMGTIAVGCALGYLDFRFAEDDWRGTRPALAAWYATLCQRPSMAQTVPKDPT